MRLQLLILGLISSLVISAQNEVKILEYSGTIADKYPIKMILKIDSSKVIGYYYYEKYKTKILLTGTIQGSRITLSESSPDIGNGFDFMPGFDGRISNNKISGVWNDQYQRKHLIFNIVVDKECKSNSESIENKLIEGDYENKIGSISLRHISDNLFHFVICTATENCTGFLQGLIEFPDLKSGLYSQNLCKELRMEVYSGLLKVSERDCGLHGKDCWFSGEYNKELPLMPSNQQ